MISDDGRNMHHSALIKSLIKTTDKVTKKYSKRS